VTTRVQLALNVFSLDEAVSFYSKLFNVEPTKLRPGYANFAIDEPPLKLVLIEDKSKEPGTLNHLGVEVDTREEVAEAITRLQRDEISTTIEDEVTCCYAVQDKVWISGPGGEPWEIYTVIADAEMPDGELRSVNAPSPCGVTSTSSCC
jgi:hypothetical protein